MRGDHLGELEEIILLIVAANHGEAYGLNIKQEIAERTRRSINLSAVHAVLYRLEEKGYVRSELGEATKRRGGKRKKFYSPTNHGMRVLNNARETRAKIWEQIPSFIIDLGKA